MIFVTVGTHEQPFDRLIKCVDRLKKTGVIQEEVVIQTGVSTYEPECCAWSRMLPYDQMVKNVNEARIVITHGGPSSFIMPLQVGKVPIVVPRQKQFGEHVNDHQVDFARQVVVRQKNILMVENIDDLEEIIRHYDETVDKMKYSAASNNERFCQEFEHIVEQLLDKRK